MSNDDVLVYVEKRDIIGSNVKSDVGLLLQQLHKKLYLLKSWCRLKFEFIEKLNAYTIIT